MNLYNMRKETFSQVYRFITLANLVFFCKKRVHNTLPFTFDFLFFTLEISTNLKRIDKYLNWYLKNL